jgi:nicotinamidase/pyrazinamidase
VKYSVLDALALGYTVTVLSAGCRGVNLAAGDAERALEEMATKGAIIL